MYSHGSRGFYHHPISALSATIITISCEIIIFEKVFGSIPVNSVKASTYNIRQYIVLSGLTVLWPVELLNNLELDEEGKKSNEELNKEELDRAELDHEEFNHEEFDESKFGAEFELMLSGV
ncbi:hypothetical protein C2G38_2170433 [Gigaspora rosea]|uniref:Uncharacterized protein n=1 Tax=Gigaspora rosea TaxID=44941 RepID=A0A397VPC1_9GLOM|nr:hypothetical protein C2G38_2170433 [Gigaspora rosea]